MSESASHIQAPVEQGPIFIVGANRSGTTLLRLMLNAHPRIAIPEEVVYFGSTMAGVPIEHWRNPPLSNAEYGSFVRRFVEQQCAPLDLVDSERLIRQIVEAGIIDFKHPYETALASWASQHGKVRWGEKTPGNLFYADILHEMFPNARFIHLVRDPRAGVNSMLRADFFPDDVVFNALSRRKFMTEGRAILLGSVPEAQRIEIRYEDLVADPENLAISLCTFLNEAFDPSMLAFHEESSRFMKQEASSTFNQAATRPITQAMLEKWRKQLNGEQIALIESVCEEQMEEWGYQQDEPGLSWRGRLELSIKKSYWDLQCWRNREIRHFTVKSPMFARLKGRLGKALTNA